jgi:hypothetical protein
MSNYSENSTPWTFSQWQMHQSYADVQGVSEAAYIQYLKNWYKNKTKLPIDSKKAAKQDFIQLLKDLSFLFNQTESDQFATDIDYNNDEDLILAIPYFAKKLTEVAKVLNAKRESIKRAKNKFNLIGSNKGLEALLYDYILRTFTRKDSKISQVSTLPLQAMFPELSAVKNNFYIELEELHDTANYFDVDPNVDITEYIDLNSISDLTPLIDKEDPLTESDVLGLISTTILDRAAATPLFNVFNNYLVNLTSNPSLSSLTPKINNQIAATQKYMGETLYGLTAVRLSDVIQPDYVLNLNFDTGDNWFLWPSGHQELKHNVYNNIYSPINIQNSSFVSSGATAGTDFTNSDLIFSDKNGEIEGAWLQGPYTIPVKGETNINLAGGDVTEFLYPYVGYDIDSKTTSFKGFSLTRNNERLFNSLTTSQQQDLLTKYYTSSFPLSTSRAIYLNSSTLINQGAFAGKYSDESDTLIKKIHNYNTPSVSQDSNAEIAYAYKFDRTDIPISQGYNYISWPLQKFTSLDNLPCMYTEEDCLPTRLIEVNSGYAMAGAVAGQTITTSDVIYKLNNRSDITQAIEAAWFGSEPVTHLNVTTQNLMIYGKLSAVDCAHSVDGTIQSSLAFKAVPGDKISFIWCGEDTFADEVFQYVPHEKNCEYGKTYPHNYYRDQDYVNPESLSDKNFWNKCTCRATYYSPIGHSGDKVTQYNAMADCLFADPFGLGDKFTFGSWSDTRGLTVKNSPQFSFWHLDGQEGDKEVGFGTGRWKTSDSTLSEVGDRMVLKTGKRYTYYRSPLRTNSGSGGGNTISSKHSPYFVCNYIYPKVNAVMCDKKGIPYDVVFALDYSRSQSFDFKDIKKAVIEMCYEIVKNCENGNCYGLQSDVQIAVVVFASKSMYVSYLTSESFEISLELNNVNPPSEYSDYQTNISLALKACKAILTQPIAGEKDNTLTYLHGMCAQLNVSLMNLTKSVSTTVNSPRVNSLKKIVLISDGVSTTEDASTILATADDVKSHGIEIHTVSMGELAIRSNLMESIASSDQTHFNLYKYLISGDGNYNSFVNYVATRVSGCVPFYPIWRKAVKDASGNWLETPEPSDMILMPGDYLLYDHKSNSSYNDLFNNLSFSQPSVSFTINVKLEGWDYTTNNLSILNIGPSYGAKPFWGKVPNNPVSYAGQLRFVDEYLPVHQPDVSTLTLTHGDYIQYNRLGLELLKWNQPLNFDELIDKTQWNKIILNTKKASNLENLLRSNKTDWIVEGSYEKSDILLEGYSQYKPARYHYVAINAYSYTENLYLKNRCASNFLIAGSGIVVNPAEPYANLNNRFYPTIATVSFPHLAVSENTMGGYLLPENLGVSTFRGKGYNYVVDQNVLSAIEANSSEYVFLDPKKYGTRNRGLTKRDQLSPVSLQSVDNKWLMEPYGAGAKAGVLLGTKENQKLTPYQSDYEILGYNTYGLARQSDDFQFWKYDANNNASWKDQNVVTNYRKEILATQYGEQINKLLANKGTMVQWASDIFGNDYGLYKQLTSEVIHIKKLPPTITFQTMSSYEINMNAFCALSVKVSGDTPFSYQWYKDGVMLLDGALPDFKVFKSTPATSGIYVCLVSNLIGVVSSVPISVTFNPLTEGNFIVDDYDDILTGDDQKPVSWI